MTTSGSFDIYSWARDFSGNETSQASHQDNISVEENEDRRTESKTPQTSHQVKFIYKISVLSLGLLFVGWLWYLQTLPVTATDLPTTNLPTTDLATYESDCARMFHLFNSHDWILYPYPVNLQAHEVLLADLDRSDLLPRFSQTHTATCSEIDNIGQAFIKFKANLTQICTSPAGYTATIFQCEISLFHDQVGRLARQIEEAIKLYSTVKGDYYVANKTAAEAFQNGRLSDKEEFQLYHQPYLWTKISTFNKFVKLWYPFRKRFSKMGETRQGLLAWERETRRLGQILREIHEMERSLRQAMITGPVSAAASTCTTKSPLRT
ncbi:MAG: hypothetical protein LQ341_003168 [Variospora aurantia]|nr:MAG: hypothetical protein LQ341_003168 [Variospora aurantia]